MRSSHVIPLKKEESFSVKSVGGKAAGIFWLLQQDYAVPPGYVISTEFFFDFLEANKLKFDQLISLSAAKGIAYVQNLFLNLGIPIIFQEQLRESLKSLIDGNQFSLAIRSSALCEDLQNASYAGHLHTSLNVNSFEGILEAILKCWASLFNEHYLQYHQTLNQLQSIEGMGVIVQKMVNASVSGVVFTCDPVKNDLSIAIAEAHEGLATNLVDGSKCADLYYYNLIEEKVVNIIPAGNQPLSLKQSDAQRLFILAKNIHAQRQWPQDIEWSIEHISGHESSIFFLQVRPITTLTKLLNKT